MNSKRFFFVMAGVVGLLVIANASGLYFGNKILQKKAQKLTSLKLDSKVLDEQQNSLAQAKKDEKKYSGLEQIAKAVVPEDKDQAEAVRELVKIASDNGITLSSITFPASTLGLTLPKPTTGTDSTSDANSSGSATKSTAPPITQVKAVDGIQGVYTLDINIQQDSNKPISYSQFINFLTSLEQNRRTSQVTNINVTPNTADRSKLSFTLTVQAYIKP